MDSCRDTTCRHNTLPWLHTSNNIIFILHVTRQSHVTLILINFVEVMNYNLHKSMDYWQNGQSSWIYVEWCNISTCSFIIQRTILFISSVVTSGRNTLLMAVSHKFQISFEVDSFRQISRTYVLQNKKQWTYDFSKGSKGTIFQAKLDINLILPVSVPGFLHIYICQDCFLFLPSGHTTQ